jgi:hypothetical protein
MAKPDDSTQYGSSDLLNAADPRAQAFAEQNAARNSLDEVLDTWSHVPTHKLGEPLPGDDFTVPDRSTENILGCPTVIKDGKVYLQGYASNESDSSENIDTVAGAPRGVQSVKDIEHVGVGIARGLANAGQEYLEFLSQPDAVNKSIAHSAEAVAAAVNHYSTRPGEIIPDAQIAGEKTGQVLADKLGHLLTPEETGELAGELMTVFIPIGRARALTDGEMEALGGTEKLEQMSATELAELNTKNVPSITFGHGIRHAIEQNVNPRIVESGITTQIAEQCHSGAMFQGQFWGQIEVGSNKFVYKGFVLPENKVHIGTFYVPKWWQ